MKTQLAVLLAVLMTVGSAIVQGAYSGRWGEPPNLTVAAEAVDKLPDAIGVWRHVEDGDPLTEPIRRELGLVNHVNRIYEHPVTGRRVQLLLMAGRPGPLVRHPPTVCYANRAHEQLGEGRWLALSDRPDAGRFRLLTYRPARSQAGERFYVAYGHSTGDGWDAPAMPRLEYGAAPALLKIQVLLNVGGDEPESDAVSDLRAFVREMAAVLDDVALPADGLAARG